MFTIVANFLSEASSCISCLGCTHGTAGLNYCWIAIARIIHNICELANKRWGQKWNSVKFFREPKSTTVYFLLINI